MCQDDIEYVLEILEDAIDNQDWDLVKEAEDFLRDYNDKNGFECNNDG